MPSLAGPSERRVGEEEAKARAALARTTSPRAGANGIREAPERLADVPGLPPVRRERLAEAPVREDDRAHPAEEGIQIPRSMEPVDKPFRYPRGAPAQGAPRMIPERAKDRLDMGPEEIDPSVREERGDESGDLLIRSLAVRQEGAERIARDRSAQEGLAPQILQDAAHPLRA